MYKKLQIKNKPLSYIVIVGILLIIFISCKAPALENDDGDDNNNDNSGVVSLGFIPNTDYVDTMMHSIPTIRVNATKAAAWNGFNARKQLLLINNACGSTITVNSCPNTILAKDLDNDGDTDLLLTNTLTLNQSAYRASSPYIHTLTNDGSGIFTEARRISRTREEYISDITDINGDGIVDLIGYSFFGNKGIIKLGSATAGGVTFRESRDVPTGGHGGETYILDYDNDGKRDIVAFSSGSAILLHLHIYKNISLGFQYTDAHTSGPDSSFHVNAKPMGDVNGDNIEDFIHTTIDWQDVRFLLSTSSNTYKTINSNLRIDTPHPNPWATGNEFYGDFVIFKDTDNKSKIAYIYQRITGGWSGTYREYTINADGSTTQKKSIGGIDAKGVYSVAFADINSDGLMDVVYITSEKKLYYRLQNAAGFDARVEISTLTGTLDARRYAQKNITIADYNKDGKVDVAVITIGSSRSEVAIYLAK